MKHPLSSFPRNNVFHITNSYFEGDIDLSLPLLLEPSAPAEEDRAIASRLLRAFSAAARYEQEQHAHDRPDRGVWQVLRNSCHGAAYKLLLEEDVDGLAAYLSNALREPWAYGLGSGPGTFAALREPGETREAMILRFKDRLVSLAVAIGALPQELSEQGRYHGDSMHMPVAELVGVIERATGTKVSRPPVMGLCGLRLDDGSVIDERAAEDAYAAERLSALSPAERRGRVAEIGGGFGGAALQSIRKGLEVAIFDLPVISVLQGFFLIKVLGAENVELFGEEIRERRVSVLPWWCFYDRSRILDVVFNRDSMAEFPEHNACAYLAEILDRGVPFLSINQEAQAPSGDTGVDQLSVGKLAVAIGLKRRQRSPYWIRKGYVEEFYSL